MIFPLEIMEEVRFGVIKRSKTEGVKSNMRERKLRSGVNWKMGVEAIKGVKQGLRESSYDKNKKKQEIRST